MWLAAGVTDMRKGFDGLAALVQTQLAEHPLSGQPLVLRGHAGDRVKILWWSGDGLPVCQPSFGDVRFVVQSHYARRTLCSKVHNSG